MKIVVAFLVLFAAVLSLSTAVRFDHYIYSADWPPAVCKMPGVPRCLTPPPPHFIVHKFQLTNSTACSPDLRPPLCHPAVESLTEEEEFVVETQFRMWKESCTPLDHDDYYDLINRVFKSYNIVKELEIRARITPSNDKLYRAGDVRAALPGNPSLKCHLHRSGRYYVLLGFRFCYRVAAPDWFYREECGASSAESCGGDDGFVLFRAPPEGPTPGQGSHEFGLNGWCALVS